MQKFVQFVEWKLERMYIHKSLFSSFLFSLFLFEKYTKLRNPEYAVFGACLIPAQGGGITKLEMISALKS